MKIIEIYKKLSLDKKVASFFLGLALIYVVYLIISGQIRKVQLQENGTYFIAQIYKIESSKNGDHVYIKYVYNKKMYEGNFKPGFQFKPNKEGAYIFIKLLPKNPKVHQYIDEGEVPDCILDMPLPIEGWKRLPKCNS